MSGPVDWEAQHAFLLVLETGSLSGAARRLGVAQPTVRARIEALEAALRTVLFTRSARGLVPTEEARALEAAARLMGRASDAFVRAASGAPGLAAGAVRIGCAELVAVAVLPPMLVPLRERCPELVLELVPSNALADLVEQEVDVAVRMSEPRQDGLVARKVGAVPLGLFAHEEYLRRRGSPRTVAELGEHDLIGPDRAPADLAYVAAHLPELDRRRFVVRTDSHPAQLEAARAGLGIAVVQRPVGLADPALRPILPELSFGELPTWIVTHESLRKLPRVRAVFDHLVDAFERHARAGGREIVADRAAARPRRPGRG